MGNLRTKNPQVGGRISGLIPRLADKLSPLETNRHRQRSPESEEVILPVARLTALFIIPEPFD
jgi:hypothetical protein